MYPDISITEKGIFRRKDVEMYPKGHLYVDTSKFDNEDINKIVADGKAEILPKSSFSEKLEELSENYYTLDDDYDNNIVNLLMKYNPDGVILIRGN